LIDRTVIISYSDADIVGLDESSLIINRFSDGVWSALSTTVDTGANTATATTPGFSSFVLSDTPITTSSISTGGGGGGSSTPPQITDSSSTVSSINADGFAVTFDVDLNDPFPTAILVPEDKVTFTMDLQDNRGINSILHASLYFSEQENNLTNLRDSKTYIEYDKYEPLFVSDPNGFFSDVTFDVVERDTSNFVLIYQITFASPMKLSDVLLYMWNTDRYIAQKFFEGAIEVIPLGENTTSSPPKKIIEDTSSPPSEEITKEEEHDPIISQEIFDSWTGYSSDITTDKEFLEHIGMEGDTIPHWLKENFAKWIKKDLTTNEDLINVIKYLSSKGII